MQSGFRLSVVWAARVGAITLAGVLASCGGGHGGGGSGSSGPPQVTVSPATASLTTAEPLTVSISVTNGSAPAPDGSVVLTSGAFNSGPVSTTGGQTRLTLPPGVLAPGSDILTASYTPSSAATASVSGAATVSVTTAPSPTVSAQSTDVPVDGHVFNVLPYNGDLFVSTSTNGDAGSETGVRVYTAASPTQAVYSCTQVISYPNAAGAAHADMLSAQPNGGLLALAVENPGLDLLDAAGLASCAANNTLVSQGSLASMQGTFAAVITPDGKYAFVANEYGVVTQDSTGANILGNVGVVALSYDAKGALASAQLIGQFSTGGQAIANVTLSPDGRRLYVTSEIAHPGVAVSGAGNPTLGHGGCQQGTSDEDDGDSDGSTSASSGGSTYGLLSVIDVQKAEANPTSAAILVTEAAGCSPVRVVETSDQQVIWVAARGDNAVLAFSTHALEANPDNALLGSVNTGGIAPVGLQLFHNEQLLAVANSNRFSSPSAVGNLTILNATPVNPTVVQTVAASYFPRSVSLAPDDATLYLSDYKGGGFQIISTNLK